MLAERLAHHPLPRVELEERGDRAILEVDEARAVPADVIDGEGARVQARLDRGVAQVVEVALVLGGLGIGAEMHAPVAGERAAHRLPALDQLLVDGVELVGVGKNVLQPIPLHDARLEERGGCVGVVLEHLGLAFAVPREVEAPVERLVAVGPGTLDQFVERLGNGETPIVALADHVRHRFEAALVQLGRGRFQRVDLPGAEAVGGALVPVDAVDRVEDEAQGLDLLRPVDAGDARLALHGI